MKRAFTLIELLVVIGIIAILVSSLLMATSGATESARAAKCLTNLKSLSAAAQARAMEVGFYPLAGSREVTGQTKRTKWYDEQVGWISWLSCSGDPYKNHPYSEVKPSQHQTVAKCPFYGTGDNNKDLYALTNGALWRYTGQNKEVFLCPEHVRVRAAKKMKRPLWSYVMNMKFGYDIMDGEGPSATVEEMDKNRNAGNVFYGSSFVRKNKKTSVKVAPDRVLMFAELPAYTFTGGKATPLASDSGDLNACDCTLHYKATINGTEFGKDWGGKPEVIGFNHHLDKRHYCGHVAFADGHVEKIVYNEGKGGLTPEQLTTCLCEGYDISTGDSWKLIPGQD